MGYLYRDGKLVCEFCGVNHEVRKYRCPFGYCHATAACPTCRKEKKEFFSRKYHRANGCEKAHNDLMARDQRRIDLLNAGQPVRRSALSVDGNKVHVLFECVPASNVVYVGYYMSPATYHAIPLLEVATPDDYRKFGALEEAPASFQYGNTTKQVSL